MVRIKIPSPHNSKLAIPFSKTEPSPYAEAQGALTIRRGKHLVKPNQLPILRSLGDVTSSPSGTAAESSKGIQGRQRKNGTLKKRFYFRLLRFFLRLLLAAGLPR